MAKRDPRQTAINKRDKEVCQIKNSFTSSFKINWNKDSSIFTRTNRT